MNFYLKKVFLNVFMLVKFARTKKKLKIERKKCQFV